MRDRDGLIALFTLLWGSLGWTLRTAATRADIVEMFSKSEIPPRYGTVVQPFLRPTMCNASAADVRAAKRAVNAAWQKTVEFENTLGPLADRVRETRDALRQGVAPEHRLIVLDHHRRRLDAYAPIRASAEDHERELDRLRTLQSECEAAYSQDQLLAFITTGKYKLTPRNLAYAVAGLPQIGWTQSFKRCEKTKSWAWPSREFEVFRMMVKCVDQSADRFKAALEELVRALPRRKPGDKVFRERLSGSWRYLCLAIDEALALKGDPAERRPYRTFEIYMRLIGQSRDVNERFLASLEELPETAQS